MPQAAVIVEGFKPEIDGEGWLVKSVEHALGMGASPRRSSWSGRAGAMLNFNLKRRTSEPKKSRKSGGERSSRTIASD